VELNRSDLPELVLVEDSKDDELMSLRGLSKSGIPCHVTVRRTGAEALEHLLDSIDPPPSLILLDYRLPKFNGLEVLTRLRGNERTRLVPVVIFSGSNGGSELAECYRVGANSCVSKPSDPNEYVERLASIAQYWLAVNQSAEHASPQPIIGKFGIQQSG
jgi:two-component system response regulator